MSGTARVGDLVTREEFETACGMMDLLCALVLTEEVMAAMRDPETKTDEPDTADEETPALPVWGCFRTVGVNRVRHQPHDWVQDDLEHTHYHCDGAE